MGGRVVARTGAVVVACLVAGLLMGVAAPPAAVSAAGAGTLSGRVIDDVGDPLPGCELYLRRDDAGDGWYETSDVTGAFTFASLPRGSYVLRGWCPNATSTGDPQRFDVGLDADVTVPDLVFERTASISGTVSKPGGTAAYGCIEAYPVDGGEHAQGYIGEDATYRVDLEPGQYRIAAMSCSWDGESPLARGFLGGGTDIAGGPAVTVHAGDQLTGQAIATGALATISGTVTLASSAPAAYSCVEAYGGSDDVAYAWTSTDEDGAYTLRGLSRSPHYVRFCGTDSEGTSYGDEWFLDSPSRAGATMLDLAASPAGVADAVLGQGGSIEGTVTDDGGQPIPGLCLSAYLPSGEYASWGYTDAHGAYTIGQLSTGSYVVFAGEDGGDGGCNLPEGLMPEYYPDSPTLGGATPVAVTAPGSTTVDIALERNDGSSISGGVGGPTGSLARDVCVRAVGPDGRTTSTRTDADGRYGFSRLGAGDHELSFETCSWDSPYEREYWDDAALAGDATPIGVGGAPVSADADLAYADDAAVFRGTVTTGGSTPVADACVTAMTADWWGPFPVGWARTASDGSYALVVDQADLPGEVRLQFGCDDGDHAQEYWPDAPDFDSAEPFPVVLGTVTEANADLVSQSAVRGRIAGHLSVSGGPGPYECIEFQSVEPSPEYFYGYTNDQGDYTSSWLEPGSYLVSTCGYEVVPAWFDGASSAEDATPVTVTVGATATADLSTQWVDEVWGRISGTISMEPFSWACVEVVDPVDGRVVEQEDVYTWSDSAGTYTTDAFAAGTYVVRVSDCEGGAYKYYGGGTTIAGATPVTVTAGATTGDIDIALGSSRGAITGTVADGSGPVGGVCVEATHALTSNTYSTVTEADGSYGFSYLPVGPYTVMFACTSSGNNRNYMVEFFDGGSGTFDEASAGYVEVSAGGTARADTTLDASATLSGTVTSSTGGPAQGACVEAGTDAWWVWSDQTTSDAAGAFELKLRSPAEFKVQFGGCYDDGWATSWYDGAAGWWDATPVVATVGGSASIAAVLDPAPTGGVTGTVTSEGGDPVYACVWMWSGDDTQYAWTGEDGKYSFSEVPAGTSQVSFSACGGENLISQQRSVTVGTGIVTLDVELLVGGAVEGTITWPGGSPVSGVCVSASDGSSFDSSETDGDGTYRLERLASGTYTVEVSGCEYDGVNAVLTTIDSVEVTRPATTTGVDAEVAEGAAVEGTVTDTSGAPLAGICVYASSGGRYSYDSTSASGAYRIEDLASGPMDLSWGGCDLFYVSQQEDGVTAVAGETIHRDVTLVQAGRISGTIEGSDDACVRVVKASDGSYVTGTCTSTGTYTLGALQPGAYKIRFEDQATGRERWWDGKDAAHADVLTLTEGDHLTGIDASFPRGSVVADFDGDGQTDVAVFRPSNGGWYIEGSGVTYLGLSGDVPVPADYDGDGASERAVFRPATGAWFVDGSSPTYLGLSGDVPVPGDYDGDGAMEFAVFRPSNGGWYIEGSGVTYLGLSGDVPVPADYDGDGTTDLAVFRRSNGAWYVQGEPAAYYGGGADVPLPGDYDGDGTIDRAVFRPSQGAWYIEDVGVTYFGLGSDIPVPGQFDGDPETDLAVFRPDDGGWYIDGASPTFFGLTGDIPTPRNPALASPAP